MMQERRFIFAEQGAKLCNHFARDRRAEQGAKLCNHFARDREMRSKRF